MNDRHTGRGAAAESPTVLHQRVVRDLTLALCAFVKERHIGEVLPAPMEVVLDYAKALVVQPDLLFVSSDRREIITDRVYGAPDMVVEVLSPRPRIGRLDERVAWFAQSPALHLADEPDQVRAANPVDRRRPRGVTADSC
jgi:Uma2 family endonuclease